MHPQIQPNGVPFMPAYRLTANNKVSLFYDAAEIEPQLEKLIGEAKHSIRMDYFIFSGNEAMRLAEQMVAKAKAGVDVQVMFDPRMGSIGVIKPGEEKVLDYLKRNGIPVAFANYDALPPQTDKKDSGRLLDHNKIIVLNDPTIVDALIVAKNKGLDVRVLLDPSDFSGLVPVLEKGPREWVDAQAVKRLLDAGVQVRYFKTSPQQDVVHAKMAVFDGSEV